MKKEHINTNPQTPINNKIKCYNKNDTSLNSEKILELQVKDNWENNHVIFITETWINDLRVQYL